MNRLEIDPFEAVMELIQEEVHVDIHGDLYGAERVAESVAYYIKELQAKVKRLENQVSDASWANDYRRGMNF